MTSVLSPTLVKVKANLRKFDIGCRADILLININVNFPQIASNREIKCTTFQSVVVYLRLRLLNLPEKISKMAERQKNNFEKIIKRSKLAPSSQWC